MVEDVKTMIGFALVVVVLMWLFAKMQKLVTKWSLRHSSDLLKRRIIEAIEILHGLKFEAEIVLDEKGETIMNVTQYDSTQICFTNEQLLFLQSHPGLIGIHNHDEDVPPSLRDLNFAATAQHKSIIVVSPHYVYYVAPGVDGWKSEPELNAEAETYLDLFQHDVKRRRLVGSEADGGVWFEEDIELTSTHEALEAVAQALEYEYRRWEF